MSLMCTGSTAGQESNKQSNQSAGTGSTAPAGNSSTQPAAARPATDAARPAPSAPPVDPSGSWKWDFTTPDDNKLEFALKLKWDGKKLDGNYTSFDNTVKIEDAKLEKDAVSFVVRPEFNGFQMEVKFNGKVAKDEIKGKINLNFGDEPQEIDWVAKRFVDADDVVGVWDLKTEAPDGNEFESTLTITKDDKGLHAKTESDFGEFAAKNVQIKDNQLLFELASDNADFDFKIAYNSKPRGNSMEGVSKFDFGGNTGEMKFTGKRQPPKEEKKAEPARPAAGNLSSAAVDEKAKAADADKTNAAQPATSTKTDDK
jgi:hypothetical protein